MRFTVLTGQALFASYHLVEQEGLLLLCQR